jgi:DNA polymerase family A
VIVKLKDIKARLKNVSGTSAQCPAHDDRNASLAIDEKDGKILVWCHAGCSFDDIVKALGLKKSDFFVKGPTHYRSENAGTVEHLTVAKLAAWKKLDEKLLRNAGLRNTHEGVIIPYFSVSGAVEAYQNRLSTIHEPRFRWRSGSRTLLYGLDRLGSIKKRGWVLLVEGPSDVWTCWSYKLPALGLPSKSTWKSAWADYFEGITVYLWREPGAEDLITRVAPQIADLYVIESPDGIKDISEAHLQGKNVVDLIEKLKASAISTAELKLTEKERKTIKSKQKAANILAADDPITLIDEGIKALGYGGSLDTPKIVYLSATTRLLRMRRGNMPSHLQLLAVPSAGKSYAITVVLCLLPPESWHRIDAGSPRVLIYDDSDLVHRVLLFDEIDSLPREDDNPAASALRNLLQEHHLKYSVVVYDPRQKKYITQQIDKPGPTCLLTTGIKRTEPQLDSRLFCIEVPEDAAQILAALEMQARIEISGIADPSEELLAFQSYLQLTAPWDVLVPYAGHLAKEIGKVAKNSRVNRDYSRLLALVKAVTIIRHTHREKSNDGRIIATVDDYRTVYDLVKKHYKSAASGASEAVCAAVNAVTELRKTATVATDPVTVSSIAKHLSIGKASASRRVNTALDNGWLIDKSEKTKGKSYDLYTGEPLPGDESGLPNPDILEGCSTVPPVSGGIVCRGQDDANPDDAPDESNIDVQVQVHEKCAANLPAALDSYKYIVGEDFEFPPLINGRLPHCYYAIDFRSGTRVGLLRENFTSTTPFPSGPETLHLAYAATAEVRSRLAAKWPLQENLICLCVESHRYLNYAGPDRGAPSLLAMLEHFGISHPVESDEKDRMRDLAMSPELDDSVKAEMLEYCRTDVDPLLELFLKLLPHIDDGVEGALRRGRYVRESAVIEARGIRISPDYEKIARNRDRICRDLISASKVGKVLYRADGSFDNKKFAAWLKKSKIKNWPLTGKTGKPIVKIKYLELAAATIPPVRPFWKLALALKDFKGVSFKPDPDGRSRPETTPFGAITGRDNRSKFALGAAKLWRWTIRAPAKTVLIYCDFANAEYATAGFLSRDPNMMAGYKSKDVYQDVANLLHVDRKRAKTALLAIQYGAYPPTVMERGVPLDEAKKLFDYHKEAYARYWQWSDEVLQELKAKGIYKLGGDGWAIRLKDASDSHSLRTARNFPVQGGVAAIVRNAVIVAPSVGLKTIATLHDAMLFEAPAPKAEQHAAKGCQIMRDACRAYLGNGDEIRS